MSYPSSPAEIPQSVLQLATGPIEHVYPVTDTQDEPDLESAARAQAFLEQRLVEDPQGRHGWALGTTEHQVPVPYAKPRGVHEVTRLRWGEGWLISSRLAAIVALGSYALFNAPAIHAAVENAETGFANLFFHPSDKILDIKEPGRTIHVSVDARSSAEIGSTNVDPAAVATFRDEVDAALAQAGPHAEVKTIEVDGGSSDDGFGGIGEADQAGTGNDKLAEQRADRADAEVVEDFGHLHIPAIKETWAENVLKPRQIAKLEKLAKKAGYGSLDEARAALDAGKPMNANLAKKLFAAFPANRGARLSADIQAPGKTKIIGHRTIRGEGLPYEPVPELKPHFIPLVPLRRFERYNTQRRRWLPRLGLRAGFRLPRLYKYEQNAENVLVRLRPEARQADGTLRDNPWADERKHEIEAREGWWKKVLRADFKDKEGADKAIRLTFVNFEPTDETVRLYGEALKIFAASHDKTKVADIIKAIFIYPEEDAGTAHQDPGRISVGGDKQSQPEDAGVCIVDLEEIEMHMPATRDPNVLAAMFADFAVNRVGVLGHELTHGATATTQKRRFLPVRARRVQRAHIPVGNRYIDPMAQVEGEVLPQHRQHDPETPPLQFDITYHAADAKGKISTRRATVGADDERLEHALTAQIVGYQITAYSGRNRREHAAEMGGVNVVRLVQGQRIPYDQAGVYVTLAELDEGGTGDYVDGYDPDPRAQAAIARHMGANPDTFPFEFGTIPDVTISVVNPEDDPVMRQAMINSRTRPILPPDDMFAFLASIQRAKIHNK